MYQSSKPSSIGELKASEIDDNRQHEITEAEKIRLEGGDDISIEEQKEIFEEARAALTVGGTLGELKASEIDDNRQHRLQKLKRYA